MHCMWVVIEYIFLTCELLCDFGYNIQWTSKGGSFGISWHFFISQKISQLWISKTKLRMSIYLKMHNMENTEIRVKIINNSSESKILLDGVER